MIDRSDKGKILKETVDKFPVGTKFRYSGYLYHVLGIFDGYNVAVKYYGKHTQWWHYEFFHAWKLRICEDNGQIKIKR